ncbi:MAG: hypothetical protein ACP5VN_04320 [Acidobacteriota bacterium]
MAALTERDLLDLYRKMRAYRWLFLVYAASAVLYGAAALALSGAAPVRRPLLGDGVLAYGVFCVFSVLLGRHVAFRPRTLKARRLDSLSAMASYAFSTLLFLLAAGETLGMAAVAAASLGAWPPWKPGLLCLWQLLVAVVLSPERSHWDRLLSVWSRTFPEGGRDGET